MLKFKSLTMACSPPGVCATMFRWRTVTTASISDIGRGQPPHHPAYDFNDEVLPMGIRWFAAVVGRELPL